MSITHCERCHRPVHSDEIHTGGVCFTCEPKPTINEAIKVLDIFKCKSCHAREIANIDSGLCSWCEEDRTAAIGASKASASNKSVGEKTYVDPKTGGTKGSKLAAFHMIPPRALWELAEHFGKCGGNGADIPAKYEDMNFMKGYPWSLSYSAAQRHLNSFWDGEDIDILSKTKHVICAAWHCFVLATFMTLGLGTDDRKFKKV